MLWCEYAPLGSHNIPCSREDSFCRDTGGRNTEVSLAQLGKQGIHQLTFSPPAERVFRERNWWSTIELANLLLSFSIGRDGLLSCGTSKGIPQEILQQRGWSSSLRRRGALQRGWCVSLGRGGALVLLLFGVGVLCVVLAFISFHSHLLL